MAAAAFRYDLLEFCDLDRELKREGGEELKMIKCIIYILLWV